MDTIIIVIKDSDDCLRLKEFLVVTIILLYVVNLKILLITLMIINRCYYYGLR